MAAREGSPTREPARERNCAASIVRSYMNYPVTEPRENYLVGTEIAWRFVMKELRGVFLFLASVGLLGAIEKADEVPTTTIVGYVRDSGCVHRFHEVVKPLPNGCLEACARAGSPLVILSKDEEVFHPVSAEMPDVDMRAKLLPFAGKVVRVSGKVYERRGSKAIAVEKIEEVKE